MQSPTSSPKFGAVVLSALTADKKHAPKLKEVFTNMYSTAPVVRELDEQGVDIYVQSFEKDKVKIALLNKGEQAGYSEDGVIPNALAQGELSAVQKPDDVAGLFLRVVIEYFNNLQLGLDKLTDEQMDKIGKLQELRRDDLATINHLQGENGQLTEALKDKTIDYQDAQQLVSTALKTINGFSERLEASQMQHRADVARLEAQVAELAQANLELENDLAVVCGELDNVEISRELGQA